MKQIALACLMISGMVSFEGYSNGKDSVSRPSEVIISYKPNYPYNAVNAVFSKKINKKGWLRLGIDYSGYHLLINPPTSADFLRKHHEGLGSVLLGLDKHKSIRSLDLIWGYNFRFECDFNSNYVEDPSIPESERRESEINFSYGVGLVYGFYYNFSDCFSLGSTINPKVVYSPRKEDQLKTKTLSLDLMDIYLLSLRYKF